MSIVVVAARVGSSLNAPWWADHRTMLVDAYARLSELDMKVVFLHCARQRRDPEWLDALPAGVPDFVEVRRVANEPSRPVDPDGIHVPGVDPLKGFVPDTRAYLDIFDEYVAEFEHPPSDFLLAVSTDVRSRWTPRGVTSQVGGLAALGTAWAGDTVISGGVGSPLFHLATRTAVTDTVREVRKMYGTISELSNYLDFTPDKARLSQTYIQPHYLIMANLLTRVAVLNRIAA